MSDDRNEIAEIADLVGEPLTSVCFVMDYLELAFEDSRVQCLAETLVIVAARTWVFPEVDSRDALCWLICQPLPGFHAGPRTGHSRTN